MSNVDLPPYNLVLTADVRAVFTQPIVVPISFDSLTVSQIDLGGCVPLGHLSYLFIFSRERDCLDC